MPIPPFDHNSVLPPHLGEPTQPAGLSPYQCTTLELCERFATTPARVQILSGYLRLRADLRRHGMVLGFQWIDGSFLEDVESTEGRDPRDIDVVTFFWSEDHHFAGKFATAFPTAVDHARVKVEYLVDHYLVNANQKPDVVVEYTRYWCGLFSHTRTGVWKGMLRVELATPAEDAAAAALLDIRP